MKYPESYRNAHKLQQLAYNTAFAPETEPKAISSLLRAWLDLEWFKREARGLPRLKAADLIANMKRLPRASAPAEAAPVEISATIEPDKESIKNSFSQTVTAPPTGDAHISGRDER